MTLATGPHPAAHGMIGNIWFDRATGITTYNIEDRDHHLLTEGAGVDVDTEIDPTQKAATSDGRSPRAILTTTFSDELASLTAGKARIFGVSVKDRGAVSMAGHTGKAFWFSKATNQFVTSSYYYDDYPQWVVDWNARKIPESYALGAIAVFATLVYLAIQTRQTRVAAEETARLAEMQATSSAVDFYSRWRALLLSDPSYLEIITKADAGDSMSPGENEVVAHLFRDLFVTASYSYHLGSDLGSFHDQQSDVDYISDILIHHPSGVLEWQKFRDIVAGVDPEFGKALDASLKGIVGDA